MYSYCKCLTHAFALGVFEGFFTFLFLFPFLPAFFFFTFVEDFGLGALGFEAGTSSESEFDFLLDIAASTSSSHRDNIRAISSFVHRSYAFLL